MWKPLILCVDGTRWLEGHKKLLEENGYKVLTATNGTDALQAFLSHPVDLVLLDHHMPDMNGDMVATHMKDSKPDVPVALLFSDERLPTSDLEAVDCFIPKSGPIRRLLEKVDYLVSLGFFFRPFSTRKQRRHEAMH